MEWKVYGNSTWGYILCRFKTGHRFRAGRSPPGAHHTERCREQVLLEQLRTIDKTRLKDKVCHLDHQILVKIDKALEISLELYT